MVRCFIGLFFVKIKHERVQINPLQSPFYTLRATIIGRTFVKTPEASSDGQSLPDKLIV
jgi:hypothetical protein